MPNLKGKSLYIYNSDLHLTDVISAYIILFVGINLILRPEYYAYEAAVTTIPEVYWSHYCFLTFIIYKFGAYKDSRITLMAFNAMSLCLYVTYIILVYKKTGMTTAFTTYGTLAASQLFSYTRRFIGRVC